MPTGNIRQGKLRWEVGESPPRVADKSAPTGESGILVGTSGQSS
jgi:hypothetical protein